MDPRLGEPLLVSWNELALTNESPDNEARRCRAVGLGDDI